MSSRKAFTLLEMLMVIAIVAVLVGLVVPAITEALRSMDGVTCTSNMRQIAMGMIHFGREGKPLAGNMHDPEDSRWIVITGGPALADQQMTGRLVKQLEYNRKIFQCPAFRGQPELGGDKVICHYAVPTIISGMPIGKMRSAYYRDSEGVDHKLPGVPLLVEPGVYKDHDTGEWSNSLGTYDSGDEKWTELPGGGFEGGHKLDSRRHSKKFHMAYHNQSAGGISLPDVELPAEQIFIIVDDGTSSGKTINCGGQNKSGAWMK